MTPPLPVILDTDLGTDIDDHWAVAMLLGCPEFDIRLITVDSGDTTYRARLLAGILAAAGRTDIPIGIGPATELPEGVYRHVLPETAASHPLEEYAGTVHEDGVGAIIDAVRSSPEPVTIITIGPVTNLAAALDRDPGITSRSRVISMAGFLRGRLSPVAGHDDGTDVFPDAGQAVKEYNVIVDVPAFQRVLASDWDVTLVPIDSCGRIVLDGDRFARIAAAASPVLREVLDSYREWHRQFPGAEEAFDASTRSSVLFDTLPVALAYGADFATVETVRVTIDDEGIIAEADGGRPASAAIAWRDYDGFLDHLVERLEAAPA